ncbi:MAG TPA: DUF4186 family protein [Cyclobacteriaceae bacterium]|jgi:hypothetical protein|nr:DUF4186 family protein [Cyclobacteriaceae bacterium]
MAKDPKPLPKVKECLRTDCKNDLHCFRQTGNRRPHQILQGQGCHECGAELVDWSVPYARDIKNAKGTFDFMKKEWIRDKYWNKSIVGKTLDSARRIGKKGMAQAVQKRLKTSVGPAEPYKDGGQTPFEGNILFYAQHATACCCRKCIEYWHNIPAKKELTENEIGYMRELMLLYINEKLPDLNEEAMNIPRIKDR